MEKKILSNVSGSSVEMPPMLIKKLKVGIYRELFRKGLLPKKQLDALIKMQNIGADFSIS